MDALLDMPIITRTFTVMCTLVTCLIMNGSVSVGTLYLYFPLVLRPGRLELWRLLTNFCVFDTKFSLSWLLSIYFFARHSAFLERTRFRNDTRRYALVWVYVVAALLALNAALYSAGMPFASFCAPFLGSALTFVFEYIWARLNPHARVAIFGVFAFPAPFLPLVLIGITKVFGGRAVHYVQGWLVGHIYFFFADILPQLFSDEKPPARRDEHGDHDQQQQEEDDGERPAPEEHAHNE